MARIDNARLMCCCIELESRIYRIYCEHLHAKTKPQGAPWGREDRREEMARIDNARLVCY